MPRDQIVRLAFPTSAVSEMVNSGLPNHPYPGVVWRNIVDIEKALRLHLSESVEEIVIRKICKKAAATQTGYGRKTTLPGQ
jgi:hypothetical protein